MWSVLSHQLLFGKLYETFESCIVFSVIRETQGWIQTAIKWIIEENDIQTDFKGLRPISFPPTTPKII